MSRSAQPPSYDYDEFIMYHPDMHEYYCANYYGHVHCSNTVGEFGQRCKLCVALNSGVPLKSSLAAECSQVEVAWPPMESERGRSREKKHKPKSASKSSQSSTE